MITVPTWAYVVFAVVGALVGLGFHLIADRIRRVADREQRDAWDRDHQADLTGSQKRAWLDRLADERGIDVLTADGLDDAILGIAHRAGDVFVVYDIAKVLDILVTRDGMTPDDARDFYDFNIEGATLPGGPAWLDLPERGD